MLREDLLPHLRGHGGGRRHVRSVHPHDLPAEGLLLIGNLDHVNLAVQLEIGAGHAQRRAPLAGPRLRGDALQPLLFGIVGLGDGGVQLVAAAGVVALKLVVDLCRGVQLLFQAVGPYQRGGTVHFVKIQNLLRHGILPGVVVQLLFHQVFAEHGAQLLRGHGFAGAGVQQGRGLVLHVRPQVVPVLRHLVLVQIDLVGDFVLCHGAGSFLFREQKKTCPRLFCWDRSELISLRCHPAWRSRALSRVLSYAGLCLRRAISVSHTRLPFLLALRSPFLLRSLPPSHPRRLSVKDSRKSTHSSSTVYQIVAQLFPDCKRVPEGKLFLWCFLLSCPCSPPRPDV